MEKHFIDVLHNIVHATVDSKLGLLTLSAHWEPKNLTKKH